MKHALYETLAFEDAIQEAIDMTDEEDTLIIVTGDHSHAFDIQGYSYRGNDILGNLICLLIHIYFNAKYLLKNGIKHLAQKIK